MIEAEIWQVRGQEEFLIFQSTYNNGALSLEMVLRNLEMYIINERLNVPGECLIRTRYNSLDGKNTYNIYKEKINEESFKPFWKRTMI